MHFGTLFYLISILSKYQKTLLGTLWMNHRIISALMLITFCPVPDEFSKSGIFSWSSICFPNPGMLKDAFLNLALIDFLDIFYPFGKPTPIAISNHRDLLFILRFITKLIPKFDLYSLFAINGALDTFVFSMGLPVPHFHNGAQHCNHLTDCLNLYFTVCCPIETFIHCLKSSKMMSIPTAGSDNYQPILYSELIQEPASSSLFNWGSDLWSH